MKELDRQITHLLTIEGVGLHEAARRLNVKYGTLRYRAVKLGVHKPKPKKVIGEQATCLHCGNQYGLEEFPQLLLSGCYLCKTCLQNKNGHPDYRRLAQEHGERCKICGVGVGHGDNYRLAVDHCHTTGKIRGLLCNRCNRGIGFLQDDIQILEKAIEYLRSYQTEKID